MSHLEPRDTVAPALRSNTLLSLWLLDGRLEQITERHPTSQLQLGESTRPQVLEATGSEVSGPPTHRLLSGLLSGLLSRLASGLASGLWWYWGFNLGHVSLGGGNGLFISNVYTLGRGARQASQGGTIDLYAAKLVRQW